MSAPAWTDVFAQWKEHIKLCEDIRSAMATYVTQEQVAIEAINLDIYNTAALAQDTGNQRAGFDAVLRNFEAPKFRPFLFELKRIIGFVESDDAGLLFRLRRYMVDNPDSLSPAPRVQSRQFVRGAWTASGSNVGTGTVHRLLVDEDGFPIEDTFADVITLKCLRDSTSGSNSGQELFEVYGQPYRDRLTEYTSGYGSGLNAALQAVSADDSQSILVNPSFSDISGTAAAITALNGWTTTAGADLTTATHTIALDTTNYYRAAALETTPAALQFGATLTIQQIPEDNRAALPADAPLFLQVAWNASVGTAVGTLTISCGSKSKSVVVSGQTGWQILKLPIDKNLWLRNYNQNNCAIQVAWTKTSGTILVDDVVCVPWQKFDNQWILIVGSATPWRINDNGTITDTETGAKYQRCLHRAFDDPRGGSARGFGYLPSLPPTPSTACTAALSAAGAGNIDNGTHSYKVTFRRSVSDTDYIESGGSSASNVVTVTDKTTDGKISLTAIPLGATGTYSRRLWRTKAGGSTYYLLAEITDNTTTIYADNIADSSLVTVLGTGVTIDDPT